MKSRCYLKPRDQRSPRDKSRSSEKRVKKTLGFCTRYDVRGVKRVWREIRKWRGQRTKNSSRENCFMESKLAQVSRKKRRLTKPNVTEEKCPMAWRALGDHGQRSFHEVKSLNPNESGSRRGAWGCRRSLWVLPYFVLLSYAYISFFFSKKINISLNTFR